MSVKEVKDQLKASIFSSIEEINAVREMVGAIPCKEGNAYTSSIIHFIWSRVIRSLIHWLSIGYLTYLIGGEWVLRIMGAVK